MVSSENAQFCHSEPLVFFSADQQREFKEKGGFRVYCEAAGVAQYYKGMCRMPALLAAVQRR